MDYLAEIAALVRSRAVVEGISNADALRIFLSTNSTHSNGAWWAEHSSDWRYVAEHLYKTATGAPDAERPEMLCGNYVDFYSAIGSYLGIACRSVWTFAQINGTLTGHAYLEVFDPNSGKWTIQDPDYNVAYVDLATGNRAGIIDIVTALSVGKFAPTNNIVTGWTETSSDALRLGNFYSAVFLPSEAKLYLSLDASDASLESQIYSLLQSLYPSMSTVRTDLPLDVIVAGDADLQEMNGQLVYEGGLGNDVVSFRDAHANVYISGGGGDDIVEFRYTQGSIDGGLGSDLLIGGEFDDTLTGGAGLDVMSGGGGADNFVLSRNSGFGDSIRDFGYGDDKIVVLAPGESQTGGLAPLSAVEFSLRTKQVVGSDGIELEFDVDGDGLFDGRVATHGETTALSSALVLFSESPFSQGSIISTPVVRANASSLFYKQYIVGTAQADVIIYTGEEGTELAGSATGLNSGDDFIMASTGAHCALYGFDGQDVLVGGAGDDYMAGGTGDDRLCGRVGYDYLNGGDGNDVLIGGEGSDELVGGAGSDLFVVDAVGSTDRVSDFASGIDKIGLALRLEELFVDGQLRAEVFAGSSSQITSSTRLMVNSGSLFFDADGFLGGADPIKLMVFGNGVSPVASDFKLYE